MDTNCSERLTHSRAEISKGAREACAVLGGEVLVLRASARYIGAGERENGSVRRCFGIARAMIRRATARDPHRP